MSGWTRLKIVLSALYWLAAGGLVAFAVMEEDPYAALTAGSYAGSVIVRPASPPSFVELHGTALTLLAMAAAIYATAAALWWALAGFSRKH